MQLCGLNCATWWSCMCQPRLLCAIMRIRLCNSIAMHVRLRRQKCATSQRAWESLTTIHMRLCGADCATVWPCMCQLGLLCATMQIKLCNSVAMHVRLRRRKCATSQRGVSTSHDNSYATMLNKLCNSVVMHVPTRTTICATSTTVDANKK